MHPLLKSHNPLHKRNSPYTLSPGQSQQQLHTPVLHQQLTKAPVGQQTAHNLQRGGGDGKQPTQRQGTNAKTDHTTVRHVSDQSQSQR
jgi:hypothetical protein